MGLLGFLDKSESLVGIDIGASSIKLLELDVSGGSPVLVNAASVKISGDVFTNNVLTEIDYVSEQISSLLEQHGVEDRRVITAMPGPSVFTKKIKMPKMDIDELSSNIHFEAGNFIPHAIDQVKLDFHIIGNGGGKQLDILVVAVKNEIIDSYVEAFAMAGLEAAVVDVDYFALQNAFELGYDDLLSETIALINIGARYSSVNICRGGESLFTGDISVGGKTFTEAVEVELGVSSDEAEDMKVNGKGGESADSLKDIIDQNVEQAAAEFNRQLSFFWNASGADEGIDRIMLTGGGFGCPRTQRRAE